MHHTYIALIILYPEIHKLQGIIKDIKNFLSQRIFTVSATIMCFVFLIYIPQHLSFIYLNSTAWRAYLNNRQIDTTQ